MAQFLDIRIAQHGTSNYRPVRIPNPTRIQHLQQCYEEQCDPHTRGNWGIWALVYFEASVQAWLPIPHDGAGNCPYFQAGLAVTAQLRSQLVHLLNNSQSQYQMHAAHAQPFQPHVVASFSSLGSNVNADLARNAASSHQPQRLQPQPQYQQQQHQHSQNQQRSQHRQHQDLHRQHEHSRPQQQRDSRQYPQSQQPSHAAHQSLLPLVAQPHSQAHLVDRSRQSSNQSYSGSPTAAAPNSLSRAHAPDPRSASSTSRPSSASSPTSTPNFLNGAAYCPSEEAPISTAAHSPSSSSLVGPANTPIDLTSSAASSPSFAFAPASSPTTPAAAAPPASSSPLASASASSAGKAPVAPATVYPPLMSGIPAAKYRDQEKVRFETDSGSWILGVVMSSTWRSSDRAYECTILPSTGSTHPVVRAEGDVRSGYNTAAAAPAVATKPLASGAHAFAGSSAGNRNGDNLLSVSGAASAKPAGSPAFASAAAAAAAFVPPRPLAAALTPGGAANHNYRVSPSNEDPRQRALLAASKQASVTSAVKRPSAERNAPSSTARGGAMGDNEDYDEDDNKSSNGDGNNDKDNDNDDDESRPSKVVKRSSTFQQHSPLAAASQPLSGGGALGILTLSKSGASNLAFSIKPAAASPPSPASRKQFPGTNAHSGSATKSPYFNSNSSFPSPLNTKFSLGSSSSSFNLSGSNNRNHNNGPGFNQHQPHRPRFARGVCGLQNLGNTCFMNSAMQCLSNTYPLTQYFLSNAYEKDINVDNPLGMRGEIATTYASLLRDLWSGDNDRTAPYAMKAAIGKFNSAFGGFRQHDAQELLAFLLDGLHEDLNRVKVKPYVVAADSNGRPDEVVAAEAWANHSKRNESRVVDLFQGQLKSAVACPVCPRTSVTFDPFMYLSLPIPVEPKPRVFHLIRRGRFASERIAVVLQSAATEGSAMTVGEALEVVRQTHFDPKIVPPGALRLAKASGLEWENGHRNIEFHSASNMLPFGENLHVFEFKVSPAVAAAAVANQAAAASPLSSPPSSFPSQKPSSFPASASSPAPPAAANSNNLTIESLAPLQIFFERAPSAGTRHTPFMPSRFIQAPVGTKGASLYRQVNTMLLSLLEPRCKKAKHDAGADDGGNGGGSGGGMMNDAADEDDDEPAELDADDEKARSSARAVLQSADVSSLYELIWDYHHKFDTKACDSPACSCPHHGICFGCALGADQVYVTQRPSQQFRCRFTATAVALFARNKVRWSTEHGSFTQAVAAATAANRRGVPTVRLQACIDQFLAEEVLKEEEKWYCSACKEFRRARKKFDFWRLPSILIVHLKRFQHFNRRKLRTVVEFPVDEALDLGAYVKGPQSESAQYDLFAVSNHMGDLGGGHYIAHAKNELNKQWYSFDDGYVERIGENGRLAAELTVESAYMLFYKRRETASSSSSSSSTSTQSSSSSLAPLPTFSAAAPSASSFPLSASSSSSSSLSIATAAPSVSSKLSSKQTRPSSMFHSDDEDVDERLTDSGEATQSSSDSDGSQSSIDSTTSRRRAKQKRPMMHLPKQVKQLRQGTAWEHSPLALEPGMLESEQGEHALHNRDTMNSSPTRNAMMAAVAAAASAAVAASLSALPSGSFANHGSPGPGHASPASSPILAHHRPLPAMSPNRVISSGPLVGMDQYMDDDASGMHSSSALVSAFAENGRGSDEYVSPIGGPDRPGPFELLARAANANGDSPNPGARVAAEPDSSSTSDAAALAHAASLALAAFIDTLPSAKSAAAAESMTAPLPLPPPPPKMPAFLAAQAILAMEVPSSSSSTPAPPRLPLDASTTSVASAAVSPEALSTIAIAHTEQHHDIELSASPATSLGIIHEGSESQSQSQDSVASAGSGHGGENIEESL